MTGVFFVDSISILTHYMAMDAAKQYIDQARQAKLSDEAIIEAMVAGGWRRDQVEAALHGTSLPEVPPPPGTPPSPPPAPGVTTTPNGVMVASPAQASQPVLVQRYTSGYGFDYYIMFISLWVTATALGMMLHSIVYSFFESNDTSSIGTFAAAMLVVGLPIFSYFFLRTKKLETNNPQVRHDVSRRRAIQLTLIITFLTALGHLISYVFSLLDTNANSTNSPIANLVHMLITLSIAGSIFLYYWRDQHKNQQL